MNKATITCPMCGHKNEVEVPEEKCLPFHKCLGCKKTIAVPKDSKNCCVVCEFSPESCPIGPEKHHKEK